MKYLIFGNGYLGNKFKDFLDDSIIDRANINDQEAVRAAVLKYQPQVVINCAAKSGHPNIDWCESNKLATLDSNLRGPLTLLKLSEELDFYFVQLGSGCVYQGDNNGKGWSEDDPPNFKGSYYSRLKGVMNELLADFDVLQLRLRMPLDGQPGPRNFITKITNYPKVISIPNSITIVDDLLVAAKQLMEARKTGIYNISNPGAITHEEILDLYKEIVDPSHSYEKISIEELHGFTAAKRSNCILSSGKLEAEGFALPPIKDRIREVLVEYKNNLEKS